MACGWRKGRLKRGRLQERNRKIESYNRKLGRIYGRSKGMIKTRKEAEGIGGVSEGSIYSPVYGVNYSRHSRRQLLVVDEVDEVPGRRGEGVRQSIVVVMTRCNYRLVVCLSVVFVCLPLVCLPACLSACLSVYLPAHLSASVNLCLFILFED